MYKVKLLTLAVIAAFSTNILGQTVPVLPDGADPGNTAKKPGVTRIGIASPATEMGKDFTMEDAPLAVRNTLQVALTDDKVETVFLDSTMPDREAKQKQCDYIFYSKVARKKGGGGMFGGMAPMLAGVGAGMIPGVGGIVGSIAASTIITATTMSGGFKSKDEVAFEYRVDRVDGSPVIPVTASKLKAKKDGEDVLTPQIRQATTATLEKIAKPPVP